MIENAERQVAGLSLLMQLSKRVREALRPEEIGFVAVNETRQLLSYRQSAFWLHGKGVFSVSGIPDLDRGSPYVQWLTQCFKDWQSLDSCSLRSPNDMSEELARSWTEWAPLFAAIAPLKTAQNGMIGLLVFFRDEPWSEQDLTLLSELAAIYAHSLAALNTRAGLWTKLRRKGFSTGLKSALVLLAVCSLLFPVSMSVQAPAEVVPKNPFVVRSPLDTVIDKFHVKPNQSVTEGELLFEFDRVTLEAKYGIASQAYQIAVEEYRQAAQTALVDDSFRVELNTRRGRVDERATEMAYSGQLLDKTEVRAPRSGIVVFAEESDWVGKNVSVGERVLTIADPEQVEILIRLPVGDAIDFELGSRVKLYLTSDPQHPLEGHLRYASYKPETTTYGVAAYRLKADFATQAKFPRIGLMGTARIYGEKVSLGYYLFRRPLTALRQRFGW